MHLENKFFQDNQGKYRVIWPCCCLLRWDRSSSEDIYFSLLKCLGSQCCWLLGAAFDEECVEASLFIFGCVHYPIQKLRVKLSAGV